MDDWRRLQREFFGQVTEMSSSTRGSGSGGFMPGVKEKTSLVTFSNDLWSKFAFDKLIEGALRISKA